ncbi:CAAX prenyl protease 1-like [Hondaea fermentalgiana]|uniref:CAAX prenyl protease n=1 Tax=Hondaea fermentalgiana TaxID=2315210 RepID=A0A2R5G6S9_9STRA|nr:CAAX prenyl protease 1-like [Hondaea fermentalgiana]|eukprot:GBG26700.1 CAAX prenyl protease 1-like [Hondaea fermentalgiana]
MRQQGWTPPSGVNYLALGLGFVVVEQAFEMALALRQRAYLRRDKLPGRLEDQVRAIDDDAAAAAPAAAPAAQEMARDEGDQDKEKSSSSSSSNNNNNKASLLEQLRSKFHKSQTYNLDKNTLSFVNMGYGMAVSAAMLLSGFNVWLWTQSEAVAQSAFGLEPASSELVVGSLFLLAQSVVGAVISMPLTIYSTFWVEAEHGFNRTTPSLFVADTLKSLAVENVIVLPLMAGIVKLVRWGGERFWLYVWGLLVGFSMVMITVYPNFIMPLFNEYKPLPDGELKSEIEKLAARLEFPLTKLYEVDGSKRSSHSNAYLYGFLRDKRIVLYDTLIKNEEEPALACTTEEVVSILAHELGHWSMSHTVKGFLLQNVVYLVAFRLFGLFLHDPDMYKSFGFVDQPVVIGLNLFSYIMAPLGTVLSIAVNAVTRKFEYEADAFAVNLGKADGLKSGLAKISIANLASFDHDPLYHAVHHSHPSLLDRLRAMDCAVEEMTHDVKKVK